MTLSEQLCDALGWKLLIGDPCHAYSWRQWDSWTSPFKLSIDANEKPQDWWSELPDFEEDPRTMAYVLYEMTVRKHRLRLSQDREGGYEAEFGDDFGEALGMTATADTVHLAVARAALKALEDLEMLEGLR